MTRRNRLSVAACLVFVATSLSARCGFADTITINPGDGVATNVTQRITGENDVVINSGASGGGIVMLNPYNSYTGTTTLNCGTLVAMTLGGASGSSLGTAGDLVLGPGTFRYAGPGGATFDRAISSPVSSTTATVLDVAELLSLWRPSV